MVMLLSLHASYENHNILPHRPASHSDSYRNIQGSFHMTAYKVPQKELFFILNELVNYSEHCTMPGYEDASMDMVEAVLPEAAKFFEEVVAPTN